MADQVPNRGDEDIPNRIWGKRETGGWVWRMGETGG